MAKNIYAISDTHFDDEAMLILTNDDGSPVRTFDDVNSMNEFMIDRINSIVRPQDILYHLGDVSHSKKGLDFVRRLNGHKRLVGGNHDIFDTKFYLNAGFKNIYGSRVFPEKGLILQHTPLRENGIKPNWINIHGHIHNSVPEGLGRQYFNVSVEAINYTPIHIDEIIEIVKRRS